MQTTDPSRRDADTTTDDVLIGVDLATTIAVVTGASSGIGAETARALASAGAAVTLAVRDIAAGQLVATSIVDQHPHARIDVVELDLTDLGSVRRCAAELSNRLGRVDLLVNNAGVMGTPSGRTADGFEMQFGTNHLGHFLLTNLLRPLLEAAPQARVINLSSGGHGLSDIIWDDPNYLERPYDKWESYGQSKTANVLFSVELDRRLAAGGGHAFSVHPGMIATNLARYLEPGDFKDLMSRGARRTESTTTDSSTESSATEPAPRPSVSRKSIPAGAATSVWAATAPELEGHGGAYLEDCGIGRPSPYAIDPEAAKRLWALSETLVGQQFD